ncbi:MAG: HipA N-terminal domain-containing protein [Coriobacteriales bacterium]|jgi:serine/threonine-protein kinase HipA|nr:HipA N-terminal domain-containing protein [Coriobacteriales bacterium]
MPEPAKLNVLLGDELVGTLTQTRDKGRVFAYRQDWESVTTAISLSMSTRKQTYPQRVVDPYLWGLIPDSHIIRHQIARQFNVSANNPMALLGKIGLDCAGAVRFCSDSQLLKTPACLHRLDARRCANATAWILPAHFSSTT